MRQGDERIARLRRLAWLLDSSIPIPGTRLSIGLEALIGLVPFVGDLVGMVLSGIILVEALRRGAGKRVLARMALNIAVEGIAGLVPVAGDVFDAAWKANQRNVRLLGEWLDRPAPVERASGFLVLGLFLALVAVALAGIVLTVLALRLLFSLFL